MAGYEDSLERLHELGVDVVALSVDSREDAEATVERLSLEYPVCWGVDAREIADRYGAIVHEEKGYLQPLGILVRNGAVQQVTRSSGPLGRLRADEVADWVAYVRKSES